MVTSISTQSPEISPACWQGPQHMLLVFFQQNGHIPTVFSPSGVNPPLRPYCAVRPTTVPRGPIPSATMEAVFPWADACFASRANCARQGPGLGRHLPRRDDVGRYFLGPMSPRCWLPNRHQWAPSRFRPPAPSLGVVSPPEIRPALRWRHIGSRCQIIARGKRRHPGVTTDDARTPSIAPVVAWSMDCAPPFHPPAKRTTGHKPF